MRSLPEYQKKFDTVMIQKNLLKSQLKTETTKREKLEKDSRALEKAQAFIQLKAQETQNQLSIQVGDIVQLALDTCFPDEFEFKLEFEPKRGKTEAVLKLMKDGFDIDPLESCGGGVADIESFGLRIAAWSLSQTNNVISLDEPFRFLSENLKPLASEVLSELSKRLKLQFIIQTHDQTIMEVADRTIMVSIHRGVSRVKIIDKD
jgi:DNA repair exonuclease SbcCD ATPase subunit